MGISMSHWCARVPHLLCLVKVARFTVGIRPHESNLSPARHLACAQDI